MIVARAGRTSASNALPRRNELQGFARSPARVAMLAALPTALVLWLVSLPQVQLNRMGDFGLVPLLPVTFWLALIVLLVGYFALLRRPETSTSLLVGHILTLIAILHMTPALLYGSSLRYSWTWKHVGIVDFFMRHAGVDHSILELNAYQYWPGFFTLNAMLAKAVDLHAPLEYARWRPPFFNTLLIGPLFLIFQTFTADRRLVWSGIGIYFLASWVGQDYFSPQACAYFLYLTFIAFCLRYLRPRQQRLIHGGRSSTTESTEPAAMVQADEWDIRDRRLLISLALVPIMAAIIPTHQLTPLMLISGLFVLTLLRTQRAALLMLLMVGLTASWDLISARPYIIQNFDWLRASWWAISANAH